MVSRVGSLCARAVISQRETHQLVRTHTELTRASAISIGPVHTPSWMMVILHAPFGAPWPAVGWWTDGGERVRTSDGCEFSFDIGHSAPVAPSWLRRALYLPWAGLGPWRPLWPLFESACSKSEQSHTSHHVEKTDAPILHTLQQRVTTRSCAPNKGRRKPHTHHNRLPPERQPRACAWERLLRGESHNNNLPGVSCGILQ